MPPWEALVSLPIVIVAGGLLYQVLGRFYIRYRLDEDGVSVILIFVRVLKIRFESVIDAKVATCGEALLASLKHPYTALRMGNRVIGKCVIIHRTSRMFPWVFITPDEPERFASIVTEQASRSHRAV